MWQKSMSYSGTTINLSRYASLSEGCATAEKIVNATVATPLRGFMRTPSSPLPSLSSVVHPMRSLLLLLLVFRANTTKAEAAIEMKDDVASFTIGQTSALAAIQRTQDSLLRIADRDQIHIDAPKVEFAGEIGKTTLDTLIQTQETYCRTSPKYDSAIGCVHPAGRASGASYLDLNLLTVNLRLGQLFFSLSTLDGSKIVFCSLFFVRANDSTRLIRQAYLADDTGDVEIDNCGNGTTLMLAKNKSNMTARLQLKQLTFMQI